MVFEKPIDDKEIHVEMLEEDKPPNKFKEQKIVGALGG